MIPLPFDPALPNLRDVVDGLGPMLQESVGVEGITAEPHYIRYKPGNKAILLFDIALNGQSTQAAVTVAARKDLQRASRSSEAVALAQKARKRSHVEEPIAYLKDSGVLIEWYPANLMMPGLAAPKEELLAHIPGFGERCEEEPTLIHYRPDRRAVMRWGDVYLKVFAVDEHFERAVRGLEFSSKVPGIVAPQPAGKLRDQRIAAQIAIPGEMPTRLREARVKMGEALAQLHRAPLGSLPELTPEAYLDAVRTTGAIVSRLLPHLKDEVAGVLSALETNLPAVVEPVVSHGDFHRRQAIAIDGGLALIDFDSMCIAHPAYDVAKFAASQVNGRRRLEQAFEWLEDLIEGYGRRPADIEWHIAASILRRATKAFRFLSPDWPTRVEAMVGSARTVIQRMQ